MPKTALCVAEKPSIAKSLATLLAGGRPIFHQGRSQYNPIYEVKYTLMGEPYDVFCTSVSGHMKERAFDSAFKKWHSCDPSALFDAPINLYVKDESKNIQRTLVERARKSSLLLIATDNDREGESIGYEIIDECRKANNRLLVKRMKFTAITHREISRALNNLADPDKRSSDACDARAEIDLRVGAAFTRFQTLRYQGLYPTQNRGPVSYGGCQFPTLGFVVDRHKAREGFLSEDFWKLQVTYRTEDDSNLTFSWSRGRVFDELLATLLLEQCQLVNNATVVEARGRDKTKYRPSGLNTTVLQQIASRKHRISPDETLKVAETLYQKGILSYPRTETEKFPESMNLTELVQVQAHDNRWSGFVNELLPPNGPGPQPRNGRLNDEAHPPIHPLKPGDDLQGNEAIIFELVTRHFLACCSRDAKGVESTVKIEIGTETFSAQGLMITDRGFLDVYSRYDNWSNKTIPQFQQGERFIPDNISIVPGETTAPTLLSEADLLSLMTRHEIGTDATMAEHIKTIKDRQYAALDRNNRLVPTELGIALVYGYDSMTGLEISLSKPHLRREFEADLKQVVAGTKTANQVIADAKNKYKTAFSTVKVEADKLDLALNDHYNEHGGVSAEAMVVNVTVTKCPKCRQYDMVTKKTRAGKHMVSCMGYNDNKKCNNTIWMNEVDQVEAGNTTCNICGARKLKLHFKPGACPVDLLQNGQFNGCIFCNEHIKEVLGIRGSYTNNSQPQEANGIQQNVRSQNDAVSSNLAQQQEPVETIRVQLQHSHTQQESVSHRNQIQPSNNQQHHNQQSNQESPVCYCGQQCLTLTSNSAANPGRSFYKCAKPQDASDKCDYFKWTDELAGPPCDCGLDSSLRTSRTGDNDGRRFFCCPKNSADTGRCKFFQWEDEPEGSRSSGGGGGQRIDASAKCLCGTPCAVRTSNSSSNPNRDFFCCATQGDGRCDYFRWTDESEGPPCSCGINTRMQTARTGDNTGRKFFVCSKPRDDTTKCDFFEWEDQPGTGGGGGGGGGFGASSYGHQNVGTDAEGAIMCNCNIPSKKLMVRKDGPNKNRGFFTCGNNRACEFFQWEDDAGGSGGSFAQPTQHTESGCYKCGQFGHFALNCPNPDGGRGQGRGRGRGRRGRGRGRR